MYFSGTIYRAILPLVLFALLLAGAREASAQAKKLYEQIPFDRITIEEMGQPVVLTVQPLKLPGRIVPTMPKLSEKIRLRLVNDPREFELSWFDIKKVELFEQMVLAEADKLTAAGKLDEAFDYFAFLLDLYPDLAGLKTSREAYLYRSAGAAFAQQKYDEALAVTEELLSQNPQYRASDSAPTLMTVLGSIADKMLASYFEKQDFLSTRVLLRRLESQYRASNESFAVKWREQLTTLAKTHRDVAAEHLRAERFAEAHDALSLMQAVWPDVEGGAALVADLRARYPRVVVGVTHPARTFEPTSLQRVSSRRAGILTSATLMQMQSVTAEGGIYVSPLAQSTLSEDGLQLTFTLPRSTVDAATSTSEPPAAVWISQQLLGTADPQSETFNAAWARALESVKIASPTRVVADLAQLHVLPQALLRNVPLPSSGIGDVTPYSVLSKEANMVRLVRTQTTAGAGSRPSEVAERTYDDPDRMIAAIRRGEVDVIDCLSAADAPAIAGDSNIAIGSYSMPTTHLITLNLQHPYLGMRTFRRALLYGINRQAILDQGLLAGRPVAGSQVVSGPFPAPFAGSQQGAYAYDEAVLPRPYDPRLAVTLRILAQAEIKAVHDKLVQDIPKLEPLVLGHPADEPSRIACRAILSQWKLLKIECTLKEFPPGVFDDPDGTCDLVYRQLAAWEPLTDATRLFGENGIAPTSNPFLKLSLQQLDEARNWQQARARLAQLHRIVHEEVEVLPLWQTIDQFAYRKDRVSLDGARISLYQDIDRWLAPAATTAVNSTLGPADISSASSRLATSSTAGVR